MHSAFVQIGSYATVYIYVYTRGPYETAQDGQGNTSSICSDTTNTKRYGNLIIWCNFWAKKTEFTDTVNSLMFARDLFGIFATTLKSQQIYPQT